MLSIGERIKIARKAAALSLRALAEEVGVSAQAISKYENGLVTPNSTVLLRLARAMGVKVEFFFRTQEITISRPAYRKRTTLPRKQEDAIMGQIQEWLERYLEVEMLFPPEEMCHFCISEELDRRASSMEDIEHLTIRLRDVWQLGMAPIEDLTALLEDKGIKIHLVNGHDKFDACTFALNGQIPVIVTKRDLPGDRQRFNIVHELGHFVMETDDEAAANRFAGAFLVPAQAARRELGKQRHALDLHELHILKHKYGLSMQGWIYRAKDLGIISESRARALLRHFRAIGRHREEPGNPYPAEKPNRLTQLVRRALAEGLISRSRAAEMLGAPLEPFSGELAQYMDISVTLSLPEEAKDYAGSPEALRH